MSICLIDTSVFVEVLAVFGRSARHKAVLGQLEQKIEGGESLFLPMATILETGNHIAHNGDGTQRRKLASRFVEQVELALEGKSPFTPMVFPRRDSIRDWLAMFPDFAMRGQGLGDLSIVQDWERMRTQNPLRRVYIWSLDQHLSAYGNE